MLYGATFEKKKTGCLPAIGDGWRLLFMMAADDVD